MNLPNLERVFIPAEKVTGYLLSDTHPVGKSKARVLRAAGFTDGEQVAEQLLALARSNAVSDQIVSDYGTKYVIDGQVQSPTGQTLLLRSVWIVEPGDDRPRFVSAYPR